MQTATASPAVQKPRPCWIGDLVSASEGGPLSIQSPRRRQVQKNNATDAEDRQYQDQGVEIPRRGSYGSRGMRATHGRGPLLKMAVPNTLEFQMFDPHGRDAEAMVCQTAQRMLF